MRLTTLLILLAAAAGWLALNRGVESPANPFPPAVIADTVTDYSPAQLWQPSKGPSDMLHDFASDRTYVPHAISYIRLEYLASEVTKPYPKLFVADAAFPANRWIVEQVTVVDPKTMPPVFSSAADLPCARDSGDLTAGADRFEIRIHKGSGPLQRCLVSFATGCRYIGTLRVLTGHAQKPSEYEPESDLAFVERASKCPKALF